MGVVVMGKIESGVISKGQSILLMPNRVSLWFIFFVNLCWTRFRHPVFLAKDIEWSANIVRGTMVAALIRRLSPWTRYSCLLAFNTFQTTHQAVQLWSDDAETDEVGPGENIKMKLKNIEEDDIMPGFTVCSLDAPCHVGRIFDAQVGVYLQFFSFDSQISVGKFWLSDVSQKQKFEILISYKNALAVSLSKQKRYIFVYFRLSY